LNLWDVSDWKQTIYPSHFSHVPGLAWSPTEPVLATSSYDRTVRLWDLRETSPRVLTMGGPAMFGGGPAEVAFAPDGRYVATANHNGTLTILKVPPLPPAYQPGPVHKPAAAKGPTAADKLDPKAIPADLLKQAGRGDAAKAPAGLVAILGGPDGHTGQIFGVAMSPDGKTLASTATDKSVRLWDLSTGKLLLACSGHNGTVFGVTFSPDGQWMVSCCEDGTVRFWEVATGKEQRTPLNPEGHVRQAAFTPDGKLLANVSGHTGARLWDARTGQLLRTFWPGGEFCSCLAISPDGKSLVTGHENGIVRIWDIATGWQLASLGPAPGTVRCIAFAPDAQSLIVGGSDFLGAWDLATLKQKQNLEGHTKGVLSCAFRGDGLLATVGGVDGTLRLWEPGKSTSRETRLFPPNTEWLHAVVYTPDGRYLATGNPDGTIYVLSVSKLIKN
jgi:WD40 repeat protein